MIKLYKPFLSLEKRIDELITPAKEYSAGAIGWPRFYYLEQLSMREVSKYQMLIYDEDYE